MHPFIISIIATNGTINIRKKNTMFAIIDMITIVNKAQNIAAKKYRTLKQNINNLILNWISAIVRLSCFIILLISDMYYYY